MPTINAGLGLVHPEDRNDTSKSPGKEAGLARRLPWRGNNRKQSMGSSIQTFTDSTRNAYQAAVDGYCPVLT